MSKTYLPEKSKLRSIGLPKGVDKKAKKYHNKFEEDDHLEDKDLEPFWANESEEKKED